MPNPQPDPARKEDDRPQQPDTWQPDQQGGQDGNQPSRNPPQTGQSDQEGPTQ